MDNVSLGSAERPYDSDMTHSYRLTEGRLIRYPLNTHSTASGSEGTHATTGNRKGGPFNFLRWVMYIRPS